jgi:shikimate dehydrogenase
VPSCPPSAPSTRRKLLAGLIGRGILASRSSWLHEQEAKAQGHDLTYTLFDLTARDRPDDDLPRFVEAAQTLGFSGLNITFPFKQAVIAHLDTLTPSAERMGAVNTVQFKDGQRIGHNTDVTGFADSVLSGLPGARLDCVTQFGAGGAGAATAHGLLSLGVGQLTIIDSDAAKRDALIANLRTHFGAHRVAGNDDVAAAVTSADGLVNATPMGMAAFPGTPFDTSLLRARQWVADIVYFPLETPLLRDARAAGCATLDGSGMNIGQAAAAFEIFTGLVADRARMRASFDAFVPLG